MRALRCDTFVGIIPSNSFLIHNPLCPHLCAQDEAMIEVSFIWSHANFEPWETLQVFIDLDTDLSTLSKNIEMVCDEAITKHKPFLRELYAKGRDVKGEARFWSSDAALFANPTATGRYRIEKVRDLFKSPESKEEPRLVPVRVQLEVIRKPPQASRQTAQLSSKTYVRHTDDLASASLPQSDGSAHSKLVNTRLHQHHGPCVPGKCFKEKKLEVLVREVNGMSIGSIDNVVVSTPWYPPVVALYEKRPDGDWYDYDGLPELPTMTYNEHVPDAQGVTAQLPKSRLHIDLAIRLVNRVSSEQHGVPLRDEKLPANVLMRVEHGPKIPNQGRLICEALEKALKESAKKDPNAYRLAAVLFDEDFRPKWDISLWIMPQAGAKQLYEFKDGLADYLDVNEVEKGNTKMYMEAHIVPMAETAKPQAPSSALLQVVDSVREDTENSEEDKYPQKRQRREEEVLADYARRLQMISSVGEDLKNGEGKEDKYPQWMEGESEDDYTQRLEMIHSVREALKSEEEEEEKYPQRKEGEDEADYERRLEAEEIRAVRQQERRQVSSDEGGRKPIRFGAKIGGRGD